MALVPYTNLEDGNPAGANDINQRFGDVIAQVNGGLDQTNLKNGAVTRAKLAADAILAAWPIDSIYISVSATNPGSQLGGSWIPFGVGRTLVGVDAAQTEFNTVEKTGGHKAMQKHKHGLRRDTSTGGFLPNGGVPGSIKNTGTSNGTWTGMFSDRAGNDYTNGASLVQEVGDGDSGNLQPYITVYFWKRIS